MDKQRTNKYLYIVIAVICGVCSLLSLLFFNIFMYAGVRKLDPEVAEVVRWSLLNRSPSMFYVVLFSFLISFAVGVVLAIVTTRRVRRDNESFRQENAAKLEAKQVDFVANVSHELKTPITIIKTHAETLIDGGSDDPEISKKMLERIDFEADHMNNIVRDLLTLAKLDNKQEGMNYKRVKLKPLIDSIVAQIGGRAGEKGVGVVYEYKTDPERVINADKTRLEQALLNISNNSVIYTNEGGIISFLVEDQGDDIKIRIADTGIGIAKADLDRVFDRFFRVDKARSRAAGGTGLGLPIAKEYIEAHGGTIKVESELGKGTAMTMVIPGGLEFGEEDA